MATILKVLTFVLFMFIMPLPTLLVTVIYLLIKYRLLAMKLGIALMVVVVASALIKASPVIAGVVMVAVGLGLLILVIIHFFKR